MSISIVYRKKDMERLRPILEEFPQTLEKIRRFKWQAQETE